MIIEGRPWSLNTWSKKILAVSGAVAVVLEGMRWTILENVSMKTMIASKPDLVHGSWVIKSMEICSHGWEGMGNGWRRPAEACWLALMR
jgi:hypothetical protein